MLSSRSVYVSEQLRIRSTFSEILNHSIGHRYISLGTSTRRKDVAILLRTTDSHGRRAVVQILHEVFREGQIQSFSYSDFTGLDAGNTLARLEWLEASTAEYSVTSLAKDADNTISAHIGVCG
jgi:hypothetical protein